MSQQPKTETDRLANVIQVLQLGQKTGVLSVERNDGPNFEQGFIILVNGQIIQASAGQRQGQDALAWLGNWGPCRFSFSAEQRSAHTCTTGPIPVLGPRTESGYGSPLPTTTPGPGYPPQTPFPRTTGNLRGSGPLSGPLASPGWDSTPVRTCHIEEGMLVIEQAGLSRAHRRLFLLIDGRRTLQELVRLVTHEPTEVHRLLKELERVGVVQA